MASTPDGGGYWFVASDGGVFAFGDARFFGSTGAMRLNKPVVGMASTPDGGGYWLVASDGGVFAFGDARFFGRPAACASASRSSAWRRRPTAAGTGWWRPTAACSPSATPAFWGSTGGIRLNAPIMGMAPDDATGGYWLVGSDGGVFCFNAPFYGAHVRGRSLRGVGLVDDAIR